MELVIGLVIIVGLAYWLYTQNTKEASPAEAPYKIETPVVAQEVKEAIPEVVVAPVEVVEPAPVKKARTPRAVKTVEVAAKVTKVAAKAPKVAAKTATTPARKTAAIKAKSKKV